MRKNKVMLISGSPRPGKSTRQALEKIVEGGREEAPGLEWEILELGGLTIGGCTSCGACRKELTCPLQDDFNDLIEPLADPAVGAMILASPVYMGGMTSQMKAFLDRTVMFRRQGFLFRERFGAAAAVGGSRNGGQELTLQGLHAAMMIHDMVVAADGRGTSHFGAALHSTGGIEQDEIGVETARNLGRRIAELMLHRSS